MKLIKNILILSFLTVVFFPGITLAADYSIDFATNPPAQSIGPDSDFVHTTLTVKDQAGKAVSDVYVKLHIHSPKRNFFISTDFPWVENTHLFEYEGFLNNGVLEFDYIYPIRGQYRIDVQTGSGPQDLSAKKSLNLVVHENRTETKNLLIFMTFLFGFGLVSGLVIATGNKPKEMALTGLAVLLAVGLTASQVYADGHSHHAASGTSVPAFKETASNAGMNLDFEMNPGAGKVGMLNTLTLTTQNQKGELIPGTTYEIKLWHIEDDKPVFSTTLFSKTGRSALNFQFFDGAEHEVRIAASNATGTVTLNKVVDVEAIHPPMSAKIKTELYFVLLTLLGMMVGFRLLPKPALKTT